MKLIWNGFTTSLLSRSFRLHRMLLIWLYCWKGRRIYSELWLDSNHSPWLHQLSRKCEKWQASTRYLVSPVYENPVKFGILNKRRFWSSFTNIHSNNINLSDRLTFAESETQTRSSMSILTYKLKYNECLFPFWWIHNLIQEQDLLYLNLQRKYMLMSLLCESSWVCQGISCFRL